MRIWYRFENQAAVKAADVYIYDEIGKSFWNDDAVSAAAFIADLKALPASTQTIRVHINSPGGDVFEAVAIANALKAQRDEGKRTVEVSIDGLAASAATIVTSAGRPIRIATNALMMVHEPYAIEIGPASAMRAMGDLLDKVRDTIVATYRWVSSKSVEELSAMMAATTWMSADEAVANGFATEKVEAVPVTAQFSPRSIKALGPVPLRIAASLTPWVRPTTTAGSGGPAAAADVVVGMCGEAGLDLAFAQSLITAKATLDDVRARVAAEKATRATAKDRATEITALCTAAHAPELVAGYIRSNILVADVRAHLVTFTAKIDEAAGEIDTSLRPDNSQNLDTTAWRKAFEKVRGLAAKGRL